MKSEMLDAILEGKISSTFESEEAQIFAGILQAYQRYSKGEADNDDLKLLGDAYLRGHLVSENTETGMYFLRAAADNGDGEAAMMVAERLAPFCTTDKDEDYPLFDPEASYVLEWLDRAEEAWDTLSNDEGDCNTHLVKAAVLFCTAVWSTNSEDKDQKAKTVLIEIKDRIGYMMRTPKTSDFIMGQTWLEWVDSIPRIVNKLNRNLFYPEMTNFEPGCTMDEPEKRSGVCVLLEKPKSSDFTDSDLGRLAERYSALANPIPLAPPPNSDWAEMVLRREFPWMKDAIEIIVRQLALLQFSGCDGVTFPPLILHGPSGAGKTTFANRLGEIMKTPVRTFSAAGNGDARPLLGTAKGWSNAQPSAILTSILNGDRANPLIIVDDLDLESREISGSISQALMTLLDSNSSSKWVDEALGVPCNLSHVSWIITCNDKSLLPPSLLNRCVSVHTPRPKKEHLNAVIDGVLRDIAKRNGKSENDFPELNEADRNNIMSGTLNAREIRMKTENALADKARMLLRMGGERGKASLKAQDPEPNKVIPLHQRKRN